MAPYIGLMLAESTNLSQSLDLMKNCNYNVLVININSNGLPHEFDEQPLAEREFDNSYPDLILNGTQWNAEVIAMISDEIDCDAADPEVRRCSEQVLKHDIALSEYLLSGGYMMLRLKSSNITNLARIVADKAKGNVLVQVPAYIPKTYNCMWRGDVDESVLDAYQKEDCWEWWNKFRWINDFNPKLKVVLELNEGEVMSDVVLRRWLGEPVDALVLPSSMFIRNRTNTPILTTGWVKVIQKFMRAQVSVIVAASSSDNNLKQYSDYLKYLLNQATASNSSIPINYEDALEIPLQPLHDNLNCYTYEIFEKDPIKYILYQNAVIAALMDRVPEQHAKKITTVIMILGAGRGPLIRSAINASKATGRKVRIYVIEKNPNAIRTLKNIIQKLWFDQDVHLFSTDMREFNPPEKADILISELLGSFGDNELSPECLDCAERLLKPHGISIPSKSTSYINPVMSPKIYCAVRNIGRTGALGNDRYSLNHIHPESGFVVLLRNVFHIDFPQPLFEFNHPNNTNGKIDNTRYKILKFTASINSVLNGVAGYFEAVLYKDVVLSINPATHTPSMQSWFPIYFPFVEPIEVIKGDVIEIHFWRCANNYKVWYEWCLVSPVKTHVHNLNGRWCPIYLA